jgi:hypothetical protein
VVVEAMDTMKLTMTKDGTASMALLVMED